MAKRKLDSARHACMDAAGAEFDAVVASEVIEHVSNVPEFCASLVALTRPGGSIVISTINRTNRSYAVAIVGAEQIMGLLPQGTHQWERFLTPGEAIFPGMHKVQSTSCGMGSCLHSLACFDSSSTARKEGTHLSARIAS